MRKNHAILCFKKLDADLTGRIDRAAFEVLFAMLLQNEIIGSKSNLSSALARLDPEGEDKIQYSAFLNWISLVRTEQQSIVQHQCIFRFCLFLTQSFFSFFACIYRRTAQIPNKRVSVHQ